VGLELAKCYVVARGDVSKIKGDLEAAQPAVEEAGRKLSGVLAGTLARVGGLLAGGMLARWGLRNAMAAEQTAVAFEVMLGSLEETKKVMEDLTEYAALTPFEMPEIEQAARGLIMFGERGEELMETLDILGNAAAGTSTPFGMIALVFNQVRGVGRLLTQDFRQLSTRGVLSLQDIADYFGVATDAAQKMLSQGKVGFEDFRNILKSLSAEGGRFANMTEKQSKTLSGLVSTLKDDFGIFLRNMVEAVMPIVKGIVTALIQVSSTLRENVVWVTRLAAAFVGAKVAIMLVNFAMQIYTLRSKVAAGLSTYLLMLAGPAGWAKIAAGIIGASIAVAGLNQLMAGTTDEISSAKQEMESLAGTELDDLKGGLGRVKDSLEEIRKPVPIELAPYGVPRLRLPKVGYKVTGELELEEGGFGVELVMRLHEEYGKLEDQIKRAMRAGEPGRRGEVEGLAELEDRLDALRRTFRAFGDEVTLSEVVTEFRERLVELDVPAGLEEIIRRLKTLVDIGELSVEQAKEIYKTYYEDSPFGRLAEQIKDVNFEVEALAGGWDAARIELEKFARQEWVSPKQVEEMKKAIELREAWKAEKEEEKGFEKLAAKMREEIQSPVDKMRDFVFDIEDLVERWRQGLPGGLSPAEAVERLKMEREKLLEEKPKFEMEAGRFGFADYGKALQDVFLKTDDPAKKTAANTAETNKKLDTIINEGIKGLGVPQMASYS